MTASYVAAVAGETVLLEIETATPGTFAAPMSINLDRNLELKTSSDTTLIARTDNPSAPGYTDREVTGLDWSLSATGVTNSGEDYTYAQWWQAGGKKNVRFSNTTTGGLVLSGLAVLTALTPLNSGGIGKKAQFSITIEGAGPATIAAHA